jgi:hypothetical protein
MSAVAVIISGVAVIVSVVTFEMNRRATAKSDKANREARARADEVARQGAEQAERYSRMPVLLVKSPVQRGLLTIQNVGKGPALNIVLADPSGDLLEADALDIDLSNDRYRDSWNRFHHLEPIGAGAERTYQWPNRGGLGLTYTDAFGTFYTTFSSKYGTKVVPERVIHRPELHTLEYPRAHVPDARRTQAHWP